VKRGDELLIATPDVFVSRCRVPMLGRRVLVNIAPNCDNAELATILRALVDHLDDEPQEEARS